MEQTTRRRYAWGAKRHLRAEDGSHRGLCGAGYDWPSAVALTDNPDDVTCGTCVFEMNKEEVQR
jgi:hypothetical protein